MNDERKITVRGYSEYEREEFCHDYTALQVKDATSMYGNGMHVLILNSKGDQFAHLDCRYNTDYDFDKVVKEWAERYWGTNLRYLRICEPQTNILRVIFEGDYNKDLEGSN
jgi:hypothetical protein